jgi:hypothetical protein
LPEALFSMDLPGCLLQVLAFLPYKAFADS